MIPIKKLIFVPSEEQEKKIDACCSNAIDALGSLSTVEKAHALKCLIQSFEDCANMKLITGWYV